MFAKDVHGVKAVTLLKMYKIESSSTKGKFYVIREFSDNSQKCSCPQFIFKGKCKHIYPIDKIH